MASEAQPIYARPMNRRIPRNLTERARNLRTNPTPAELAIWHCISRYRPAFTRQHIEPPFIIDLVCRQVKLAIEFDGSHIWNPSRKTRSALHFSNPKAGE
jgi:very-short-patch-repair endonuclease